MNSSCLSNAIPVTLLALLTAHGLLQKPNAPSKTCVSGLQPEADPTTGPTLANVRPLGRSIRAHPTGRCSCDSSRYTGVVLHGRAPAAGHHTGRAGKGEAGKALPELALGFSLSAGERGQTEVLPLKHQTGDVSARVGDLARVCPSLGSEDSTCPRRGLFPGLGTCPCDCVRPLHMCEAVFPKTRDPWTIGWTERQCHTVSFSHLQHSVLPKQCVTSYKTSSFDCKDSSPHPLVWQPSQQQTNSERQGSDYIGNLRLLGGRTRQYWSKRFKESSRNQNKD